MAAGLDFQKMHTLKKYVFGITHTLPEETSPEWKQISMYIFLRWLTMQDAKTATTIAKLQPIIDTLPPTQALRFIRAQLEPRHTLVSVPYLTKTKVKKLATK